MTTIAVIGDITPDEARPVFEKWFGGWKAAGPKPDIVLPAVPANGPAAVNVPDPTQVQDSVNLSQQLGINRFHPDYYALQLGDHVLGGGFYATRLYRDLRQKAGYGLQQSTTRCAHPKREPPIPSLTAAMRRMSRRPGCSIEQDLAAMRSTNVTERRIAAGQGIAAAPDHARESSEETVARGLVARALLGLPLDEPVRAAQALLRSHRGRRQKSFREMDSPRRFRTGRTRAGAKVITDATNRCFRTCQFE